MIISYLVAQFAIYHFGICNRLHFHSITNLNIFGFQDFSVKMQDGSSNYSTSFVNCEGDYQTVDYDNVRYVNTGGT